MMTGGFTTNMAIEDLIPFGKDHAINRERLEMLTGYTDRVNRQLIEDARTRGAVIINDQDGSGYYQTAEPEDIARQWRQNQSRAMAILKQQKALRNKLKAAGAEHLISRQENG